MLTGVFSLTILVPILSANNKIAVTSVFKSLKFVPLTTSLNEWFEIKSINGISVISMIEFPSTKTKTSWISVKGLSVSTYISQ